MPDNAQLAMVWVAAAVMAVGGVASLARLWRDRPGLARVARGSMWVGVGVALVVLIGRMASRGAWMPLRDNIDAMISLAVMLSLLVLYVQRPGGIAGLDWFVMPIVVLLLLGAALLGRSAYHPYVHGTWQAAHYTAAFLGAAAFAIAAATGAMYIITSRKLRSKSLVNPAFGSLERLEHLTMRFVVLGFALLTIATITGLVPMLEQARRTSYWKLALATGAWVVYAIVLHAPINPSFRGRKVAILSIFGFVLMVGTVLTVMLMAR